MAATGKRYECERLTLELSLKPFSSTEPADIRRVCLTLCDNWRALARRARTVAFQLFIGDGDEIFQWRGELGDRINWCNTTGCSNMPHGYNFVHPQAAEPIREQTPEWTYEDVRLLVRTLKEVTRNVLGKEPLVGTIVDAGAEFVESEFKFRRHPELMKNGKDLGLAGSFGPFVDATARLRPDSASYAAYPDGIPEGGVPFGEFLGKQFASLSEAVGFDYVWFSNGLGFGYTPWETRGELFDGNSFKAERFAELSAAQAIFWREFDRASGGMPIGIRGSNTSIGADLSVFGASTKMAYAGANVMAAAPNPPWGSINPGLELAVYMSRMATNAPGGYSYRFYYNDPWFHSDPWYGYYGAESFDILMPLKIAKLGADGRMEYPSSLHLFALDDDRGGMDEHQVWEVTGGFYRAFRALPDEPGAVTWLYPYEEMERAALEQPERLPDSYFHDAYVRDIVNQGFPLNTVLSSVDYLSLEAAGSDALERTILLAAAPEAGTPLADAVVRHALSGRRMLLYGSLARTDARLLELLGLQSDSPIEGDLALRMGEELAAESAVFGGSWPERIDHRGVTSGGGIRETMNRPEKGRALLVVSDGISERVYAAESRQEGLALAWIRGTAGMMRDTFHADMPAGRLIHAVLARYGYRLRTGGAMPGHARAIVSLISRRDGAYRVTGHKPDDTTHAVYGFPEGAPLFLNTQALVEGCEATYSLSRTFDYELRCFVIQSRRSVVACREAQTTSYTQQRAIEIRSLEDATLAVLPPLDGPKPPAGFAMLDLHSEEPLPWTFDGFACRAEGVTGDVLVLW